MNIKNIQVGKGKLDVMKRNQTVINAKKVTTNAFGQKEVKNLYPIKMTLSSLDLKDLEQDLLK